MSKLWKLTDEKGQTYGGTQWGPGVTHTAPGIGPLCTSGWIHAYEHPLIAVLMNPIHGNFANPRMWEAEGEVGIRDGQLKCGVTWLTTVREIPLPQISTEQRVEFAIRVALKVCSLEEFQDWADKWLSGVDRTEEAARAAERAVRAAARAAEAAWAAAEAAWAAAEAAWAARAAAEAADLYQIAEQVIPL